jgi:hypothetical protein
MSSTSTRFLGMFIHINDSGSCTVSVSDKRKDFGFKIQRYPDMKSMIPESLPYGTFMGLLHYYYRICTDSKDFIKNSSELAVVLMSKGCMIAKLCKIFRTFIESKTPLRWWRIRRLSNLVFRKFRSTVRALQIEPSYQT